MNSSDNLQTVNLIEVKKSSKVTNAFTQSYNLSGPVVDESVVGDLSNFLVLAAKINPYYISNSAEEVVADPDVVVDPSPVSKNGAIDENLTIPICTINPDYPGFLVDPIATDFIVDPIYTIMPVDSEFFIDESLLVEPIVIIDPLPDYTINPVYPEFFVDPILPELIIDPVIIIDPDAQVDSKMVDPALETYPREVTDPIATDAIVDPIYTIMPVESEFFIDESLLVEPIVIIDPLPGYTFNPVYPEFFVDPILPELINEPVIIIDPIPEVAIPVEWCKPNFIGTDDCQLNSTILLLGVPELQYQVI